MKMLEMSKDKASRREKIMLNIILAQDDYEIFQDPDTGDYYFIDPETGDEYDCDEFGNPLED